MDHKVHDLVQEIQGVTQAELHVHSDASFIDGYSPLFRSMPHAKAVGYDAVGLTDHGVLTNVLAHLMECKAAGLKPITGMEGYILIDELRFHLTLLADGRKGFESLVQINNIAHENHDGRKPVFTIDDLTQYNDGLIVLTGCPASPFQDNSLSDAGDLVKYLLRNGFTRENFFAELMVTDYETAQGSPIKRSMYLSETYGLTPIRTGDIHFPKKSDAKHQQRLMSMASGYTYDSSDLYFKTPEEIFQKAMSSGIQADERILQYVKEGIINAGKLADRIEVVKFNSLPKLPHIPDAFRKLEKLVEQGFQSRLEAGQVQDTSAYRDRIKRELDVIRVIDFATYFLILVDSIEYANKHNIWIGKGRGSGAGSLLLYVLGITDIDPIYFGLSFERFLNFKRFGFEKDGDGYRKAENSESDVPDVDLDIESEGRLELIDYMKDKWDAVAVATYSTYRHKQAIRDLGKSFGVPKGLIEEAAELGLESEAFETITRGYEGFKEMYEGIALQIRHVGRHAGGVVINEDGFPLPIIRLTDGTLVSAWTEGENRELSQVGLVKFDYLALIALSQLHRMYDMTGKLPPLIPDDGDPVFELFRDGDTVGVFQFGSSGIIKFLRDVEADSINDLVAVNALFRPGPLDSGAAFEYPKMKKKGEQRSLHPDIDHILEETYGVITYQEQFMKIVAYVLSDGDYDESEAMAEADIARKVLTKAGKFLDDPAHQNHDSVKKYRKLRNSFFDGAISKGWTEGEASTVWDEIKTHARYSFNKSHSVAYSVLAYEMAWYKYHYPLEFYTACLNVERHKPDKVEMFMFEAVLKGFEIVPPHINSSTDEYTCDVETGKLFLPLTAIKFVGESSYKKLELARKTTPVFKTTEDYMRSVPKSAIKKRGRSGLLAMGAFDGIESQQQVQVQVPKTVKKDGEFTTELITEDRIALQHEALECESSRGLSAQQIQKRYLGFVLPTKRFVESRNALIDRGFDIGLVERSEMQGNGRWAKVYAKEGTKESFLFWYSLKDAGGTVFQEGDFVAYKKEKGKAEEIVLIQM